MNRHDNDQPRSWLRLPRRRLLQAMLGLLGGFGLPARATRDQTSNQATGREADFYHAKEQTRRR